ncbi:hypothetical protein PRK78_002252 [Emydomyces testavorans]|uniref:Geranylgeranyl pyrophosphate synthetase n=1 Tax=Emydomyces testavorans TaxID=2070801 RepID=A0AAF0DEJ5_9EURO|nr:hypothetical protein PRK78_002252 [Emydomyces testavorans]
MSGFDWERARQRRAAGITSATWGKIGAQDIFRERRNSPEKSSGRRAALSPDADSLRGQSELQHQEKRDRSSSNVQRTQLPIRRAEFLTGQTAQQRHNVNIIRLTEFISLRNEDPGSAKITDSQYAGSYNWLADKVPTILIPGAPPIWTPIKGPHKLKQDDGEFFRDQNSARWPKHPLEPAIRSVFEFNPRLKPDEIDVVTCAGTIGNIFKFASSLSWTFKFDMEKVGNTVFMVRKERTPDEVIKGIYGYGHTFHEANTSWDPSVKGSVSHQRILRYKFGGLNLLVRYEADGFLADMVHKEDEPFEIVERQTKTSDINSLIQATGAHKITENDVAEHSNLRIHHAGCIIPQEALLDIKTRHEDNEIDMPIQLPRLWARQVRNFILAYHKDGFFDNNVTVQDLSADIEKWEQDNKLTLSLVAAIMKRLIAEINKAESGKLEVQRNKNGPLMVQPQTGASRDALPAELKAKWETNNPQAQKEEELPSTEEEWYYVNQEGRDLLLDY